MAEGLSPPRVFSDRVAKEPRGARPGRFELPTTGSVDRCSIQLSYGRKMGGAAFLVARPSSARFVRRLVFLKGPWWLGVLGSGRHWYDHSGTEVNAELWWRSCHPNRRRPTTRWS